MLHLLEVPYDQPFVLGRYNMHHNCCPINVLRIIIYDSIIKPLTLTFFLVIIFWLCFGFWHIMFWLIKTIQFNLMEGSFYPSLELLMRIYIFWSVIFMRCRDFWTLFYTKLWNKFTIICHIIVLDSMKLYWIINIKYAMKYN